MVVQVASKMVLSVVALAANAAALRVAAASSQEQMPSNDTPAVDLETPLIQTTAPATQAHVAGARPEFIAARLPWNAQTERGYDFCSRQSACGCLDRCCPLPDTKNALEYCQIGQIFCAAGAVNYVCSACAAGSPDLGLYEVCSGPVPWAIDLSLIHI